MFLSIIFDPPEEMTKANPCILLLPNSVKS